jgi:tetratricopeptide (TPR) repeat protein
LHRLFTVTKKLQTGLIDIPAIKVYTKYNREDDYTYFLKCLDICFDISEIDSQENRNLLSYFSLFSQATISYSTLKTILKISNEQEEIILNTQLNELIEQGWIKAFNNELFSCHGLIQQLIIEKEKPTYVKYKYIIDNISEIIDIENPIIKPELLDFLEISIALNQTLYKYDKNIDSLEIIASNFNRIGNIYYDYERHNDCLPFYEKTIDIRVNELKKEDFPLARVYNNYGLSLGGISKFDEALKYLNISLELKNKALSEKKIVLSIAVSYTSFGHIYNLMGEYRSAILNFIKGSKLLVEYHGKTFKQLISENNDHIAVILNNIAYSLNKLNKPKCAVKFSTTAIDIDEKRYPNKNNIDLGRTYLTHSQILTNLQDFLTALSYIDKTIDIFKKGYKPEDTRFKEAIKLHQTIDEHLTKQSQKTTSRTKSDSTQHGFVASGGWRK